LEAPFPFTEQTKMKNTKWYRVTLRFFGDVLDVDAVEPMIGLTPTYQGRKGAHIDDNPRYAKNDSNFWTCSFTADEDTAIPFDQQIGDLLDVLEPYESALKELLGTPGIDGELFLGFSSDGQGGGHFSRLLLERVSRLGLGLTLDLYPPTGVSETSARMNLYSIGALSRPVPPEVPLVEFIRTGALGPIEIGMPLRMVEGVAGPPSKWSEDVDEEGKISMWHYGDISLTFEDETLQSIDSDDFEIPAVGNSIIMQSSLLTNCLTLSQIEHELGEECITYEIKNHPRSDSSIYLVAEGGATMTFRVEDEGEPVLIRISHRLKS
jgi:hypothetical protein